MEAHEYLLVLLSVQQFIHEIVIVLYGGGINIKWRRCVFAAHGNPSRVAVVRNAPYPLFERFDMIFFHAAQNMDHDFARQILRVAAVVQAFDAKAKHRLNVLDGFVRMNLHG